MPRGFGPAGMRWRGWRRGFGFGWLFFPLAILLLFAKLAFLILPLALVWLLLSRRKEVKE